MAQAKTSKSPKKDSAATKPGGKLEEIARRVDKNLVAWLASLPHKPVWLGVALPPKAP